MRTYFIFLFIIFVKLSAQATTSTSWDAIDLNKQGVRLYKEQNFASAQEKFGQALAGDPFSAEIQLNLGLSLYQQGQVERAQAAYQAAARLAQDPETRFVAFFDLAESFGKQKKIDEALRFYQAALEIRPDSKESKTNIELLLQQQQGGGEGQDKNKDDKDKDKDKNKDKDKDKNQDQKGSYEKNKPQPQKFNSKELKQSDVNKILGEIKQQEQKIRADYNKKEVKESPRDKDW